MDDWSCSLLLITDATKECFPGDDKEVLNWTESYWAEQNMTVLYGTELDWFWTELNYIEKKWMAFMWNNTQQWNKITYKVDKWSPT